MAKKYKISEGFVKNFLGLFGSKEKPKSIQDLIDSDPVLNKLDQDVRDINKKVHTIVAKDKELSNLLKKYGFEVN